MGERLTVRVLGGLDVAVGEHRLADLASAKARALLSYLAVTGGAPSRSALAGLLWSDLPEDAARSNLRLVLTKLRRSLPDHVDINRQSVGLTGDVWVDARELNAVADDPDALLAAVGLCRGELLAGVDVPGAPLFDEWLVAERAACRAAMLGVLDRAMRLARDRADAATGIDVARRVLELEPLHEEAHRALMWFLAADGQPSAALAQFERCRSVLAAELGADPSPATLALHDEIRDGGIRDGGIRDGGFRDGGFRDGGFNRAALPVPRELPRAASDFTGRGVELTTLLDLLAAGEPVIGAIDGMGGVGKSALAAHVANQVADHFPDGQLYLNLHGATPGLAPLEPVDALGRMLRALGLDPGQIPADVDEAAARFRSLAAQRRLLVLLDDARDAEQVRPLLPASRTCAVLITSRQALTTLEGVRAVHLDVLPHEQALHLLGRVAGPDRVAADPPAADDVVHWCGRLPLAIRLAGARLAARPGWPLRALAQRLADATRRLDELAAGDQAVHACFQVSVHVLRHSRDPVERAAATGFGLLSLPDGPDLGLAAAARLLDRPADDTRILLERLVDAQLLESPQPDRYRFHDLVRLYARRYDGGQHPEVRAALTRLFDFYVTTAWQTQALLRPGDRRAAAPEERPGDGFPDMAAALAWLEAERPNLMAAIDRAAAVDHAAAGQLARALFGFFLVRGHWQDGVRANTVALAVARRADDRPAQAQALLDLGALYRRLGQFHEAVDCLEESLVILRGTGDRDSEAASLTNLGAAHQWLGHHGAAITCHQKSLAIYRDLGDRHGQAHSLSNLGVAVERLGRYDTAIAYLQESLDIRRELGARHGQAQSLAGLGAAYRRMGEYRQAVAYLEQGLTVYRELGDRHGQAHCLTNLGAVDERLGRHDRAIARLEEGLSLSRELGGPFSQAEALRHLGDSLWAVGRHDQAESAWREALTICELVHLPEADELRSRLDTMTRPA